MANPSPRLVTPGSVAFDISVEKEVGSSPSSIQKRLDEEANSPRRETTLNDINKKLSEAAARKEVEANISKAKIASHNAKVEKVHEKLKQKDTDKNEALEKKISSKLSTAEAKRKQTTSRWVQRLSQTAKDKLQRAQRVRDDEKLSANQLEMDIEQKEMAAKLIREEQKLKAQEGRVIANHDKLLRGQNALGMAKIEAKLLENQSERKIAAAGYRRDMQQILASTRAGESAAAKKNRVAKAQKQEVEEAKRRQAEIEGRIKAASERKEQAISGKVEKIAAVHIAKMQRAADARMKEDERAKENDQLINAKVELVNQRRENIIREQLESLQNASSLKETAVKSKKDNESKTASQKQKLLESKLRSADERKEGMLESKVKQAQSKQQAKKMRAKNSWLSSLNEEKDLKQISERKVKDAAERKNKLLKELVDNIQGVNRSKIEKVQALAKTKEHQELKGLAEIDTKLMLASKNREIQRRNIIAKASSKKRMLSPQSSPTSKKIEDRINQASLRREVYLAGKVEKAKGGKNSPKVKRALFASLSPKQNEKSSPGDSRLEEVDSRLEEISNAADSDQGGEHWPHHGLYLIGGGIAIVLVGLLSYLKASK